MRFLSVFFVVCTLLFCGAAQAQPTRTSFDGSWVGMLAVPGGGNLHIVFSFRPDEQGHLSGRWASPDQGGYSGVIDSIKVWHDTIHIQVFAVRITYDGVLSSDSQSLAGNLIQSGYPLPLKVHKADVFLGEYKDPNGMLRLAFQIAQGDSGKKIGAVETLDEAEFERPLDGIYENHDTVDYLASAINAEFKGVRSPDGGRLVGTWYEQQDSFPVTLIKNNRLPLVRKPQDPIPPFPYKEEEVSYQNASAGITLGGTLTIPEGRGPFPVALLITGSGQQDRNEALMGHRPFWVIADYLTRRGIAVLRVDDRGIGKSEGGFDTSTTLDFVSDVRSGVAYLKSRKEIDPHRIGLIGHSEGGMIAPLVAQDNKDIHFIVLLAGIGIPTRELMHFQRTMLLTEAQKQHDTALMVTDAFDKADSLISVAKNMTETELKAKLDSVIHRAIALQYVKSGKDDQSDAIVKQYTSLEIRSLLSPWHRFFIAYDPKPALERVHCPVLAIDGSLDKQVEPKLDLDGIQKDLKKGGNRDVTIKDFEGLNHLLQTAKTGSVDEYPKIQETIAPEVLETMSDWIKDHTK